MLYIVDNNSDLVLLSVDAWNMNAETIARDYIHEHDLKVVENTITFMGDLILKVEGR